MRHLGENLDAEVRFERESCFLTVNISVKSLGFELINPDVCTKSCLEGHNLENSK